jgi:hypothetical protein
MMDNGNNANYFVSTRSKDGSSHYYIVVSVVPAIKQTETYFTSTYKSFIGVAVPQ